MRRQGVEFVGPGPALRYFDLPFALAADDAGGGVQDAVSVLGSARASDPDRHSSRSQHSRSQAIMAATHHAWLIEKEVEGR